MAVKFVKVSNGLKLVNTTPHPLTFLDGEEIVEVPVNEELVISARSVETEIAPHLITTEFVPNDTGNEMIETIVKELGEPITKGGTVAIIGSLIAANAFSDVVAMVPAPGFERVAPAEKRMSIEKFNIGVD